MIGERVDGAGGGGCQTDQGCHETWQEHFGDFRNLGLRYCFTNKSTLCDMYRKHLNS